MSDKSLSSSKTPKKGAPKSFEAALRELEEITARLEQGEAPLDEIAAVYERGALLVSYCRDRLSAARGKIQKLEKQTLSDMDDVGD